MSELTGQDVRRYYDSFMQWYSMFHRHECASSKHFGANRETIVKRMREWAEAITNK